MDYSAIPSVIYTTPEVASVGETLEGALAKGIKASYKELSMMYSGRYVVEGGDQNGICKLIIDTDADTLIGFHALGSYASEFVSTAAALIALKTNIETAKKIIFPHPTVSEIIHEAMFVEDR
jgi:dihydrolipoamide dehydrogenase